MDSFNFIFVQKAKYVELRNLSYLDLDAVDISISRRFVEERVSDHGMESDTLTNSATKVVKHVVNSTIVQHSWSKVFEASVGAKNLLLKGDLARLAFEAGKWALISDMEAPVFWERIGEAREQHAELNFEASASTEGVINKRVVMDEASCVVPFKATLFITTENDGVVPLKTEGELTLFAFGNIRAVMVDDGIPRRSSLFSLCLRNIRARMVDDGMA